MPTMYPQGWLGPDAAIEAWDSEVLQAFFTPYPVRPVRAYQRFAPWDHAIMAATGSKWLDRYPQEIGDCVSFGMAQALQNLACIRIWMGEPERFAYIFPPYLYAIGRMSPEGGNGSLGSGDGSLGSWQVAACLKHGVLFFADDSSLQYSGSVAKAWGSSKELWKKWQPTAADNLIRAAAKLTSGEQVRDAICSGAMVTCASSVGYEMQLKSPYGPDRQYFVGSDSWNHQKCWIAYQPAYDKYPESIFDHNSWPKGAHGPQTDGPEGGGWVELERIDEICRSRGAEIYGIATWSGFPALELDLVTA